TTTRSLEGKLGEEPLVLAGLVLLLQTGLGLMECSSLLLGLLQGLLVDGGLVEVDIHRVAGGKEMRVGNDLDEGLQLVSLRLLLLSHRLGDLAGIPVDSGHKGMRVGLVRSAIIVRLHDESLKTGILSSEDEDDLSGLHDLSHVYL
ncbi:hypothetical protein PMAYCL1PPCAC_11979, partial [Pristionchus mayeri]